MTGWNHRVRRDMVEAFAWFAVELVVVAWVYLGWTIIHG